MKSRSPTSRPRLVLALAVLVSLAAAAPATAATAPPPIVESPADQAAAGPSFTGAAAKPRRVPAPTVPRHRYMARNGSSNIHNDGYMTDTYTWSGPLGRNLQVRSARYVVTPAVQFGLCGGTIAFDRRGRIVTVCIAPDFSVRLRLLDPGNLALLASYDLPRRLVPPGVNPFQSFTGGGYFYLDHRDRAVIPTSERKVVVVALRGTAAAPRWERARTYDISKTVPAGDGIGSVLPDSRGLLWYVSRDAGVVGVINPRTGRIRTRRLSEAIGNSFAVDPRGGGVYIATEKAQYRFDATRRGFPRITWRARYKNIGEVKPGQVDAGTGTTPTLMGRKYVAITDNADPMNIVVYKRARKVRGRRLVCEQPVFRKGAGATENSLIGTGRSLIVENNYGYSPPAAVEGASTTTPGIQRVDVRRGGRGCRTVWRSTEIGPSVVPKLSLANGLAYFYTKPAGAPARWYLTAISFRTGKTVWRKLVGTGFNFNNNYAGLAIARTGAMYLGVLGGTVKIADGRGSTR